MNQHSKYFVCKTLLIVLFVQLATVTVSNGQTKAEKIDQLMSLYSGYGQFNGSVLVADGGKVIFKKGF